MRAVSCAAFDGRVVFHTRHVSLAVYEQIETLEAVVKDVDPKFAEKYAGLFNTTLHLLALTTDIEFNFVGDENPMLLDLRDFWQAYSKASGTKAAEIAIKWRKETSTEVISAWVESANAAQNPIRRPETLPFDQLTPEEQAEASQPDSPLPESA